MTLHILLSRLVPSTVHFNGPIEKRNQFPFPPINDQNDWERNLHIEYPYSTADEIIVKGLIGMQIEKGNRK